MLKDNFEELSSFDPNALPEIKQAAFNSSHDSMVVATTTGFLVFSLDPEFSL